jgi:hypothetical protein
MSIHIDGGRIVGLRHGVSSFEAAMAIILRSGS